jgi:murein DD-endopeptidase MepM/ murein hydrolase activator NlpD
LPGPLVPAGPVSYIPPIVAPVIDPFRPPSTPYGPGNRGIEYATVPGSPVVAAADGHVSFAGQVAGSLHVTVQHPDGVRVTASFLATMLVVTGARVVQGQVIGTTADRLHISARRGDVYFDPASLWAAGPPHVHLVPLDGGGGPIRPYPPGRKGNGASHWGSGPPPGYARPSARQHRRVRTTTLTRVHPRSPPAPDPGFVEP